MFLEGTHLDLEIKSVCDCYAGGINDAVYYLWYTRINLAYGIMLL